jgi:hypothetical protein
MPENSLLVIYCLLRKVYLFIECQCPMVISHERGKDREVLTISGTYPWSFVTQIFHNGQPSHGDDFNLTKGKPWFSSFLDCSNPFTSYDQGGIIKNNIRRK